MKLDKHLHQLRDSELRHHPVVESMKDIQIFSMFGGVGKQQLISRRHHLPGSLSLSHSLILISCTPFAATAMNLMIVFAPSNGTMFVTTTGHGWCMLGFTTLIPSTAQYQIPPLHGPKYVCQSHTKPWFLGSVCYGGRD